MHIYFLNYFKLLTNIVICTILCRYPFQKKKQITEKTHLDFQYLFTLNWKIKKTFKKHNLLGFTIKLTNSTMVQPKVRNCFE